MSVTEAARKLGVGRPALSNLLNGRAALSQNMALRLEATFGADRTKLLQLQAAADLDRRSVEDRAVAVGAYAPSFLTIEARRIEEWAAGSLRARELLPVLLRRLIHATGRELRRVDFPGYDNAQRHGWDGRVEADAATLWVPEGRSFWEFGVDRHPKAKGDADYRTRLRTLSARERAQCTFVFVTPRNWAGKDDWVRGKQAAGDWKAVSALDASDIEQWLENTISPRIWLAGELGIPAEGCETIERSWDRWVKPCDPPMTPKIFEPSVTAHLGRFREWLKKEPGGRPFTVAADSREEALAFVACLLRRADEPAARDHAVVFESASTLRALAGSPSPFIPIVCNEDTERELTGHYRQRHCVVVLPRNAVDREPDTAVEMLGHEALQNALTDMGIERERVSRLANGSGRSPTVLRRRLSQIDAIRIPPWAGDREVARRLIPIALVGAWHDGSKADREILEALAGRTYGEVEKDVADLLPLDDCPVWRVGQYRGVVSKIDALFAISPWVTGKDVTDFVDFAEYVLSESDPALELPEDRRWAAGVYRKVREHSGALRTGVCETLVMLSVHGNGLLRDRVPDVGASVAALVQRLLDPFTSDNLRSHDRDLPGYAEAAPNEFLTLLEKDLARPQPVLLALLKPASSSLFDSPARTGVLWALERLAWNPQIFPRVVYVLAGLSQTKIDDNWVNKPIGSLSAIFRSWMPQTAASVADRIRALETLCHRFPDIGWRICIQQFDGRQQVAIANDRPRWRDDAAGAGNGATRGEWEQVVRKALDLAFSWPRHDERTLSDLVERLDGMPDDGDRLSVWDVIDDWSQTETDERARAELREKIRVTVVARRGLLSGLKSDQSDKAREVCEKLASRDPVRRHAWLFATEWLEYSADELDDDLDFHQREKRVDERRAEAMTNIWSVRGLEGALALLSDGEGWTVGRYAARCATGPDAAIDVLRACLAIETVSAEKLDAFMGAFMVALENFRAKVVLNLAETSTVERRLRLFKCAPFRDETWRLLDGQDALVRDAYWREVRPGMVGLTQSETTEVVDRLLEAGRPREAFLAVWFDWGKVETSRLKRLLTALVEVDPEPEGQFRIERWLSSALDSLDGRPGVTADELAQLEFAFIQALDHSEHGIPNLERKVTESPSVFVQALALIFKRSDAGQDPPEWRVDGPGRRAALGSAAFRLLRQVRRIPGASDDGSLDGQALSRWVDEARRLCREHGRSKTGDEQIGELLSRAPSEEDGSWPCRPVCEVLERVASPDVAKGFRVGVYNARGVVWRGLDEGGAQERELGARYRAWAERWAFEYPYVANVLERIAKGYGQEGEREDSDVLARQRLER